MVSAILQPAQPVYRPLLDPIDGTRSIVEERRWVWPMVFVIGAMVLSTLAIYLRYDAGPTTVRNLEMAGELKSATEQELHDKVDTARNIFLVAGVAKAVFLTPLMLLAIATVLKLAGWLFEVRAIFGKCFAAASVAMLPLGLYHLLLAGCALAQHTITQLPATSLVPATLGALVHPASPKLATVLGTLDFFNLWSAVVLGLGFSQASEMRRSRAVVLSLALYAMYVGVAVIGASGMGKGHP